MKYSKPIYEYFTYVQVGSEVSLHIEGGTVFAKIHHCSHLVKQHLVVQRDTQKTLIL
jgi:hypothetical protein